MVKNALVIGAEALSRVVDWTDRSTCILFGDGAGAVVLQPSDESGVILTNILADGGYGELLSADCEPCPGKCIAIFISTSRLKASGQWRPLLV